MFIGIDRNEVRRYISANDPDLSSPTVFILGLLDPSVRNYIEEITGSLDVNPKKPDEAAKMNFSLGKRNHLVLKYGLKGIDNFIHPKTKEPVKLEITNGHFAGKLIAGVSDEVLNMFPSNLKAELAEVIWNEDKFTETDEKN